MDSNLRWRVLFWIVAPVVFGLLFLVPTMIKSELPEWWVKYKMPTEKVQLGLDLQGGMHLILGVKLEKAVQNNVEQYVDAIKEDLKRADIAYDVLKSEKEGKYNEAFLVIHS